MKIETILTPADVHQFNQLVAQAHQAGASGVRFFSEVNHVVVVGIVAGGELLTWFASPAHSEIEAVLTERVVLAGIQAAGLALKMMQSGAAQIATDAIKKASTVH
ncbi:MAG: hypothetical protein CO066_01450 [Comamonadaceae bacterium CG_4_9_14_0_8_um_filter_60_18]|nr:MAG: hypothetical protein CO066_01450 [Comamonadaceae bacterium CG_4_9_14_0_8_um_filter_60_18]